MVPLAHDPLVRGWTGNRLRVRTTPEGQFRNGCRAGKGIPQSPRPTSPIEQHDLPLNGVLNHSSSSSHLFVIPLSCHPDMLQVGIFLPVVILSNFGYFSSRVHGMCRDPVKI